MKILYPGSFDPITNGHMDVIKKAVSAFGELTVLVLNNHNKTHRFDASHRKSFIESALGKNNLSNVVSVQAEKDAWIGDIINKAEDDVVIVRGLRSNTDFDYEMMYEQFTNRFGARTVYFTPNPQNIFVSSTLVRNLHKSGGSIEDLVPIPISELLK